MVNSKKYLPEWGDIVWLNYNPQSGHEQAGRRPALVISSSLYNNKTGLALFCPITNQVKDYPFEVRLPHDFEIRGVILADQVKNFDWRARDAEFICKVPNELLKETLNKLRTLLNL